MPTAAAKPAAQLKLVELINCRVSAQALEGTKRQVYLRGYRAGLEQGAKIQRRAVDELPPPPLRQALRQLAAAVVGRLARIVR